MASYQLMKNNLKRLMQRKSTYIIFILIPILITVIGLFGTITGQNSIYIGVNGSEKFYEDVARELNEYLSESSKIALKTGNITEDSTAALEESTAPAKLSIICERVPKKTVNAVYIMGDFDFIINEGKADLDSVEAKQAVDMSRSAQSEEVTFVGEDSIVTPLDIRNFTEAVLAEEDCENTSNNTAFRMLSLLLLAYMTIATFYTAGLINDRKAGLIERFKYSGHTGFKYAAGFTASTGIVTGLQLGVILLFWKLLIPDFTYSFAQILGIFVFLLIVVNIYSIIISVISKSEMMAGVLASSGAVILALIGGGFFAVEEMPEIIQVIGNISPVRWLLWIA